MKIIQQDEYFYYVVFFYWPIEASFLKGEWDIIFPFYTQKAKSKKKSCWVYKKNK